MENVILIISLIVGLGVALFVWNHSIFTTWSALAGAFAFGMGFAYCVLEAVFQSAGEFLGGVFSAVGGVLAFILKAAVAIVIIIVILAVVVAIAEKVGLIKEPKEKKVEAPEETQAVAAESHQESDKE